MDIRTNSRIVCCGKTGSGKSNYTAWLALQLSLKTRVWIYDFKGDYHHFLADKARYTNNVQILPSLKERLVVYQPRPPQLANLEAYCAIGLNSGHVMMIIEEADVFAKTMGAKPMPTDYYNLIHLGRSYNVGCMSVTRRPRRLHTDLLSQCEHIITFFQHDTKDLMALQEWIEDSNAKTIVHELAPYHYYHYSFMENRGAVMPPCPRMPLS